jgi:hypothetical protein
MGSTLPGELAAFAEHVVPILQVETFVGTLEASS